MELNEARLWIRGRGPRCVITIEEAEEGRWHMRMEDPGLEQSHYLGTQRAKGPRAWKGVAGAVNTARELLRASWDGQETARVAVELRVPGVGDAEEQLKLSYE